MTFLFVMKDHNKTFNEMLESFNSSLISPQIQPILNLWKRFANIKQLHASWSPAFLFR